MKNKLETHQEALERLQLKVGDKVKILTKADTVSRGWDNAWCSDMDEAIGKTGIVNKVLNNSSTGVEIIVSNIETYYNYPAFVLEKVEEESTNTKEPLPSTAGITVMDEAKSLIYGDREKDYGKTSDNFRDIAKGWEVITKATITPEQVGLMMAWLKICRANQDNCEKRDSLVDCCGYMGCIEKVKNNL